MDENLNPVFSEASEELHPEPVAEAAAVDEIPEIPEEPEMMEIPEEPEIPEKVVDLKAAKHVFSVLGLGAFVILVLGSVLQIVAAGIFPMDLSSISGWLVAFVPLYVVSFPVGYLIMRRIPVEARSGEAFGGKKLLGAVFVMFTMMYVGNFIGNIITNILSALKSADVVNPVDVMTSEGSLWIQLVVLAFIGPIYEEFIFRKAIIDRARPYGEKLAVVVSAAMFGLFHGNLSQMFYAFGIGLVLGYVYLRTNRLRYSILLHMGMNFVGGIIAPAIVSLVDLDAVFSDDVGAIMQALPGMLAYYAYAICMIGLAITGVVVLGKNAKKLRFEKTELELPPKTRFKTAIVNVGMILLVIACLALTVMSVIV